MVVELMGFHDKAVNVYRTKNYIVVQKYTLEFDENCLLVTSLKLKSFIVNQSKI